MQKQELSISPELLEETIHQIESTIQELSSQLITLNTMVVQKHEKKSVEDIQNELTVRQRILSQ